MLNTFRTLSGSVAAKILLGLLVVMFAVWGIGDMLRNPSRNPTVATVGGTAITAGEVAREVKQKSESIRRMLGDNASPEILKSLHLPERALHDLIDHALINAESESLGLIPSDADVAQRIRSNPAFQDSPGHFDKMRLEMMLRSNGMSEKTYVEQLRRDMAANLLVSTLLEKVPVSDAAVRTLFAAAEEQRAVTLYTLTPSLVGSVPAPDDAQIKGYYDQHAQEFTVPEYRALSYVALTGADVKANADVSAEELQAAYRERMDEFRHQERRTVEQLLYDGEDKAKAAEALIKDGKSFAEVAKDTDPLNKDSLSLGKVEKSAIPENAADAVFALKAGDATAPIQDAFGWHIFKVTAMEKPSVAPFEEVRPMLEKEMRQRSGDEALNKLANKLEDDLAGGATLNEAAQGSGLKVVSVGAVNHNGESPDGSKPRNLPAFDKFLDTAFKTEEKTESTLMTSQGGVYYILRVDSITPERVRPLAEVKDKAVAGWQKQERQRLLSELAKDIGAKFAKAATRGGVIAKYNLEPSGTATIKPDSQKANGAALPPQLVSEVFSHKPQEGTNAYPLQDGNFVLAVVDEVIAAPPPDKFKEKLAQIRQSLEETTQNEIIEEYTHYLMTKYRVSVNDGVLEAIFK